MTARHCGPMKPPPRVEFRGQRDGLRHAYSPTGRHPALCGATWFDPRFAWAPLEKCQPCVQRLEELTQAALMGPATIGMGL